METLGYSETEFYKFENNSNVFFYDVTFDVSSPT